MRVVYVSTVERGGPVWHLVDLVPRVIEAGADALVVCQTAEVAAHFRALRIPTLVSPVRDKFDLRGALRLRPLLASADVVHTQDRRAGLLVRPLARLGRAKVAHTLHGLPVDMAVQVGRDRSASLFGVSDRTVRLHTMSYFAVEATLSRFGAVVVPSQALARFIADHGVPRARIEVIASGVDVQRSAPDPLGSPVVIGTAAMLEPLKAIDVLLEACARVTLPLQVEIYGDGSRRGELERRAASLGLKATFHGNVDDVRQRLTSIDLFVLASRGENLPISILEAMAAALPVVATRVGGVRELVDHGTTGLLVEPDDVEGMARAITTIATDGQLHDSMGRAGAERVGRLFRPAEVGRKTAELYRRLLGDERAGSGDGTAS